MRRVALIALFLSGLGCQRVKKAVSGWRHPPKPVVAKAPAPPAPLDAGPPPAPVDDGVRWVSVTLAGPIERALAGQVDPQVAPALALVIQRLTLWWFPRADQRKGDVITALYDLPPGQEPHLLALRYASIKHGQTFTAYAYRAPGAPFARYFDVDGQELEERLRDAPVAQYEEVTSLLNDGRHHHGVDFKCPVGSQVVMPFDGTVVRKNWNWRFNGNCVEVVDSKTGRHAKFLHLSEVPDTLKPGMHLGLGQPLARSGNTGHTTAPHLHYQLESPTGRILDPFQVQATYRRHLPPEQLPAFKQATAALDSRLTGSRGAIGVAVHD